MPDLCNNEGNYKFGKLLFDFLELMKEDNLLNDNNRNLFNTCFLIAKKIKSDSNINDLNISNLECDKTLDLLFSEIKEAKDKENPGIILDRLHTLSVKFIKQLSDKYNIECNGKSLNAIFGMYIKELEKEKLIESDMTLFIVKSNIFILEKFNHIRNNRILAHDKKFGIQMKVFLL